MGHAPLSDGEWRKMNSGLLTASSAVRKIRNGEMRAIDFLNNCQQQIERHNPAVNALITLDFHGARQTALAIDELPTHSAAETGQALLGVPLTVKDSFCTQGLRTTSSFLPLVNHVPNHDATLVKRLKAAGAVLLGKSNLSELAGDPQCWSPLFGPTRNPWDLGRTPGGSSGGSAAAIAMGFSLLEAGSDIGGSIRIPAAYCGVTALKATENRIPRSGHIPHLPGGLRTVRHMLSFGLLGREVADLQLGFPVICGPDGEDFEVPPVAATKDANRIARPLRIAWWDDFAGTPLCWRTRHALGDAVNKLQAAGHHVERQYPADFDIEKAWHTFGIIAGGEIGLGMPGLERFFLGLGRHLLARKSRLSRAFAQGVNCNFQNYNAALASREQLIATLEHFLGEWDVWLCPTAPSVAYPAFQLRKFRPPPPLLIDDQPVSYIEGTLSLTTPFSLTGSPVVSLPAGVIDGLPVGLQVIGQRWAEDRLLRDCARMESILGGFRLPPLAARSPP